MSDRIRSDARGIDRHRRRSRSREADKDRRPRSDKEERRPVREDSRRDYGGRSGVDREREERSRRYEDDPRSGRRDSDRDRGERRHPRDRGDTERSSRNRQDSSRYSSERVPARTDPLPEEEEYDLDEEMRVASKRKRAGKKAADSAPKDVALDADITPEEMQMMQAMGIPFGFDTTQGKQTEDDASNAGAVKVQSKRAARQYMNRKGGFNRPLAVERTGEKALRN